MKKENITFNAYC